MVRKLSLFGIVVTLALTGCSNENKKLESINSDALVRQLDSMYAHHIEMQQADSLTNTYMADAVLLTEGEAETKGIRAIQDWYRGAFDYGLKKINFQSTQIELTENNIIEIGKSKLGLQIGDSDTLSFENYKYIHVWTKQANGKYKLSKDMWNNDAADEK